MVHRRGASVYELRSQYAERLAVGLDHKRFDGGCHPPIHHDRDPLEKPDGRNARERGFTLFAKLDVDLYPLRLVWIRIQYRSHVLACLEVVRDCHRDLGILLLEVRSQDEEH